MIILHWITTTYIEQVVLTPYYRDNGVLSCHLLCAAKDHALPGWFESSITAFKCSCCTVLQSLRTTASLSVPSSSTPGAGLSSMPKIVILSAAKDPCLTAAPSLSRYSFYHAISLI
jgi:hypothetical protein